MLELMKKFMKDEEGQDLVEYALLLVFLALPPLSFMLFRATWMSFQSEVSIAPGSLAACVW